jgi:hypothetical protein
MPTVAIDSREKKPRMKAQDVKKVMQILHLVLRGWRTFDTSKLRKKWQEHFANKGLGIQDVCDAVAFQAYALALVYAEISTSGPESGRFLQTALEKCRSAAEKVNRIMLTKRVVFFHVVCARTDLGDRCRY